jgi:hypothetical protein
MMRKILFGVVIVLNCAAPAAFAQDQCVSPQAPAIPDGARAARVQVTKALAEVKAFITASDEYQACMLRGINANQKEKERIGAEYAASARAFNTAQQQQQQANRPAFSPPGAMGGAGGY